MGKRACAQSPGRRTKKTKADPVLTSIADVIMEAEDLPDQCRSMLVDMLPFSLTVASDERHEAQAWAVEAVAQTLNFKKASLEANIVSEDAKLSNLKSSEDTLVNTVKETETALDAQKQVVHASFSSLTEATEAVKVACDGFLAAQTEQQSGEVKLASAQDEKSALESAFEAHFKVPMEEGNGPHIKELQPLLKHIEMDGSLRQALPSSCGKSKEDRGSFDDVVVGELEKALSARIKCLVDVVAVETPASDVRKSAVDTTDKDHNAKQEALAQATETLEAAQKEQSDREASLAKARLAVEEFQPQVESMTALVDEAKEASASFEAGPFAGFLTYKARVAVSAEAAPAGA